MAFPPIVPGVTGGPESSSNPLTTLLSLMGGGSPVASKDASSARLRSVVEDLREIAKKDPRVASRCTRAIEALQGDDDEGPESDEMSSDSAGVGALAPGVRTPI